MDCESLTPTQGATQEGMDSDIVPVSSIALKVGAQERAEMLRHSSILWGPQQRGQNQKSKTTLGVTMMPLVSQNMGL